MGTCNLMAMARRLLFLPANRPATKRPIHKSTEATVSHLSGHCSCGRRIYFPKYSSYGASWNCRKCGGSRVIAQRGKVVTWRVSIAKVWHKLPDREIFYPLLKGGVLFERWRNAYNTVCSHSSLSYRRLTSDSCDPLAGLRWRYTLNLFMAAWHKASRLLDYDVPHTLTNHAKDVSNDPMSTKPNELAPSEYS